MKTIKILSAAAAATFSLGISNFASAQVTSTGTVASGAQVELTISGNVVSSVQLILDDTGNTTFDARTDATMPVVATATVDFGSFNTLAHTPAVGNGLFFRGTGGAHVVAELNAQLLYSGASTGQIAVKRKNPFPTGTDIPVANLRYRLGTGGAAVWAVAGPAGTQVPISTAAAANLCSGIGACQTAFAHELAVWVPDTQAAGAFTSIVVYEGTAS